MTLDDLLHDMRAEMARGERGKAFRAFWREVDAELSRFYANCSINEADADSLSQRCALVVWRKLDKYKQTGPNSFVRWLRRIASFELRAWRQTITRRQGYAPRLRMELAPDPVTPLSDWVAFRQEHSFVARYIEKLATPDRQALAHDNIRSFAEEAGITYAVANGRWHRAIRRLRKLLRRARTSWRVRIPARR